VKRAALAVALLGGAFALSQGTGSPPDGAPAPVVGTRPAAPRSPEPVPVLERDPFEFAGRAVRDERPEPRNERTAPVPILKPLPPPQRLIGFEQRGERARAILVLGGETFLLAVGESAAGYTLVGSDGANAVRLRTPEGAEIALEVPE
jgi:hypothetical protein